MKDHFVALMDLGAMSPGAGGRDQVLMDGQVFKYTTPFHDLEDTQPYNFFRVHAVDPPAQIFNGSAGHLPLFHFQQT